MTSSRRLSSSRRTAASLLSCLRKQKSDQDPLMRRIALPLRLAQAQVATHSLTFLPVVCPNYTRLTPNENDTKYILRGAVLLAFFCVFLRLLSVC